MNAFIRVHEEQLLVKLTMFDRMIFRGHLNKLYFGEGAFEVFLWRQGVPLKDFGPYVKAATLAWIPTDSSCVTQGETQVV